MKLAARLVSIGIGVLFLVQGARWLLDPTGAAQGLGMDLLAGVGASTQIGDMGAFFVSLAIMIGLAQRPGASRWLHPPILLLCAAAVMRTLAWAVGPADLAPQFIVPEVVMAALLFWAARLRSDET